MFSNFRQPIIFFISSFFFVVLGLSFRIMHWSGGKLLTGSMLMVQAFAIIWLVVSFSGRVKYKHSCPSFSTI